METDKPLAGALRAAQIHRHGVQHCYRLNGRHLDGSCCLCEADAQHFARESGLAELVEAVEKAAPDNYLPEGPNGIRLIMMGEKSWQNIVAAARRVREK